MYLGVAAKGSIKAPLKGSIRAPLKGSTRALLKDEGSCKGSYEEIFERGLQGLLEGFRV